MIAAVQSLEKQGIWKRKNVCAAAFPIEQTKGVFPRSCREKQQFVEMEIQPLLPATWLVDMQQHKKLVDITLLRLEFPSCPLDVGLAVLEVLADRHVLPAEATRAAMVTTTTTATKNEHLPRPCSANNLN
ncbi:hypothetical protein OsI_32461 [Oryza sativa Indica Group]|uniref:Uncharacterized protein n=1 Tax=Oryza sativa subsp. indica TaxID=39946 RepID=B8BEV2_ORYSI|nr:hypothetical protein OsI_32461 [Oryza sativa Indica Group]